MPPENKPTLWFDFKNTRHNPNTPSGRVTVLSALLTEAYAVLDAHGRSASWKADIKRYMTKQGADARIRVICKITAKYLNLYAQEMGPAINVLGTNEALWYAAHYPGHTMVLAIAALPYVDRPREEKEAFIRKAVKLMDAANHHIPDENNVPYALVTAEAVIWMRYECWHYRRFGRYTPRLQKYLPHIKSLTKPILQAHPEGYELRNGMEGLLPPPPKARVA